jgi:hypothetical protein
MQYRSSVFHMTGSCSSGSHWSPLNGLVQSAVGDILRLLCTVSTTESRQVTPSNEDTEMKRMIWIERECSWRQPDVLKVSITSFMLEQQAKQEIRRSRRQALSVLHGVSIKKAVLFTVTVVRTSIWKSEMICSQCYAMRYEKIVHSATLDITR